MPDPELGTGRCFFKRRTEETVAGKATESRRTPKAPPPGVSRGQEKARPLPTGLKSFGRGCLKGSFRMPSKQKLCKCETVNYNCKNCNMTVFYTLS
ncbi:hypothetical protein NMD1_01156 [Novosphingobium sp. MD-1]|nr:hypothetical protein NMD1_01156 [Novosphingobium sp. MD-1]